MPIDESTGATGTGANGLTRGQVAERLGISVSAVRRREGTALHPIQDGKGVWRFDAFEVERLGSTKRRGERTPPSRKSKPGNIAARVFRLIEQGHGLREIVVRARQPPELVRQLYREWLTGLPEGERARSQSESERRQRREQLEDEHMQLEQLRIFCR